MSYNILKSISVISLGVLLGYNVGHFFNRDEFNQSTKRNMASYPVSKIGKGLNTEPLFNITIDTDGLAQTEAEVSLVKVHVQALQDIPKGFSYTWSLQHDSQLIEGLLSDELGEISAHQSQMLMIKVKGFSKQAKKFINFSIRGEHLQKPILREMLISSRIEDSLEYTIQQNELKKQKMTINKLGGPKAKSKFNSDNIIQ